MGIALLSAARLVDAWPSWMHWIWPSAGLWTRDAGVARASRSLPHRSTAAPTAGTGKPLGRPVGRPAHRPLRVLRVLEPQQMNQGAGRMVISGRMADVCAELDRLAEAEASLSRH